MVVWLVVLSLFGCLFYLNQVGLPGFAKKPILESLRARGLDLQFTRLRLRWSAGLVAENVQFGRADVPDSPRLTLAEVQVRLNPGALAHLRIQIDGLVLRQGHLVWPIVEPNRPARQLSVENIQSELRLLPGDEWSLDHFKANFASIRIQLSGHLANASALEKWGVFRGGPPQTLGGWQERIRELADTLDLICFSGTPDLQLDVRGDAQDLQSFRVSIIISAPGAETPWGSLSCGRFTARLSPPRGNEVSHAEVSLSAEDAQTRWAAVTNLQVAAHIVSLAGRTNVVRGDLTMAAELVATQWGSAAHSQFTAQWVHALTNPVPLSGEGRLLVENIQTRWGSASNAVFSVVLAANSDTNAPAASDASWSWWTNIQPYLLGWEGSIHDFQSEQLHAEVLTCGGNWCAPVLNLTNLQAGIEGHQFELAGALNVTNRLVSARLSSDIDPHLVAPLLDRDAVPWLAQFSWKQPPKVKAELSLTLPAWTDREPDWRGEVLSSLGVNGQFQFEQGASYRQFAVTTARSRVLCSNLVWQLPDFTVTRPEGGFAAESRGDARRQEFYSHIRSTFDLRALRPLFGEREQGAFDLVTFTEPPRIDAEIRGDFHQLETLGFKGHVSVTNFTFRGESASSLDTSFEFTNKLLAIFSPRVERGTQVMTADGLAADFNREVVYLTNGFSTSDPNVVARAIGPQVAAAVAPYHFIEPPAAHVHGVIPMYGEEAADLHFELEGGPFHWWKFKLPHVTGHVHWLGQHVTITNAQADFYGGRATGSAAFDFTPAQGADFHFDVAATGVRLQALMADLSERTNHLEGILTANLHITRGNTATDYDVDGHGVATLTNGLIWEIPLFGVFSPVLEGISPGLGTSRANSGTCTYTIKHGVINSDNLDIRSPVMRLRYRGTVGLNGQVNARVDADLLRDMWLVGPVVSTVLWPVSKLFEYKVTGTLDHPRTEPVFLIPKLVLLPFQMPFHPVRTLKGLMPEEENGPPPNSPPARSQ